MARRSSTLAALLLAAGLASAAAAQADAYAQRLDQAKQLRVAGSLDRSEAIVRGVLKESPGHFRATYTLGLIQLDRGQADQAIKTLRSAIAGLNGRPAPDPTIYNTLGWAQMGQGLLAEARVSFNQGHAQLARLSPASQRKLLNNMALLSRLEGKEAQAQAYLKQAVAAGSPQAQRTLNRMAKQ